ncbi:unnamed protein product [Callosobruchus maculatus]|uniref:Uncharacterized protein n=1 Tax=Callosobruchus maculatus TaxID=64391 RepID=A0A653BK01_CALMS|nr:unnamed protein product [Callosobruchus maculatus]
MQCNTETS